MREVSNQTFGYLIAYLIPGFVALWGVSPFSSTIRAWLGAAPADAPSVGGFVYVTVASVGVGLTISTLRWVTIDSIHHFTGIKRPRWNFAEFSSHVQAYDTLTEVHYRYYQFYGNTIIAALFWLLSRRLLLGLRPTTVEFLDLGLVLVAALFFVASRDTFRKYHSRLDQILGSTTGRRPAVP